MERKSGSRKSGGKSLLCAKALVVLLALAFCLEHADCRVTLREHLVLLDGSKDGRPAPAPAELVMSVQPFVDALPTPDVIRLDLQPTVALAMHSIKHKYHRDIPATPAYSYGTSQATASVPGPTLLAARGTPAVVRWRNNITDTHHFLPVDYTTGAPSPLHGGVPTIPHLHGMTSESASDGYPDSWFTRLGDTGPTFIKQDFSYPNAQPGATLWYHDHVIGMTRLNVRAGMYGAYILRDEALEAQLNLPQGDQDVVLALGDVNLRTDGSMYYPTEAYNLEYHSSWRPESYGRFSVVNGKVAPFKEVQQALYRLRFINAASARFFNLSLCIWSASAVNALFAPPDQNYTLPWGGGMNDTVSLNVTAMPPNSTAPGRHNHLGLQCASRLPLFQIATSTSLLPSPLTLQALLLAPGQRAEALVDFSKVAVDDVIIMTNNGPIPFPGGNEDDNEPLDLVMMFNVSSATAVKESVPNTIPAVLSSPIPLNTASAVNFPLGRNITLVELDDKLGNPIVDMVQGLRWRDPSNLITPQLGTSEIWNYINLTPDAHPIHFHLVPSQVIERRVFNASAFSSNECDFDAGKCFLGEPAPPFADEVSPMDTVIAFPGMVTRVLINLNLDVRNITFDPTQGPGYVIHCHILDHEDSDMMRPVKIVKAVQETNGAHATSLTINVIFCLLASFFLFHRAFF